MTDFVRSKALNNVPSLQVQQKVSEVLKACSLCSAKSIGQNIDGVCSNCSLIITLFNRYREANIPIEYWPLKMEKSFTGDPKLLSRYKSYVSDLNLSYTTGSSLCLAGSHGVGKSLTACSILKKACQKGFNCLYTDLSSVVAALTQAPFEEKYLARKELISIDFLVIDEADTRFFNQSDASADLFGRSFESIIRTRLQNKLPIILATNSPNFKEAFHSLFKESIGSLMNRIPNIIVLGDDYRKINK